VLHSGWHDDVVKQGSLADTIKNAAKFGEPWHGGYLASVQAPVSGKGSFDLAVAQLIF
jgi:hypothetical protein